MNIDDTVQRSDMEYTLYIDVCIMYIFYIYIHLWLKICLNMSV